MLAKELTVEFLGFEDSQGNKYPPDQPPEWLVKKISAAFIKILEEDRLKLEDG